MKFLLSLPALSGNSDLMRLRVYEGGSINTVRSMPLFQDAVTKPDPGVEAGRRVRYIRRLDSIEAIPPEERQKLEKVAER